MEHTRASEECQTLHVESRVGGRNMQTQAKKPTREQRLRRERRAARRKARRAKVGTQLGLLLKVRRWGGARPIAGRPPAGERAGVPHLRREGFQRRYPLHVVWGMRAHVWNLRSRRCAE